MLVSKVQGAVWASGTPSGSTQPLPHLQFPCSSVEHGITLPFAYMGYWNHIETCPVLVIDLMPPWPPRRALTVTADQAESLWLR